MTDAEATRLDAERRLEQTFGRLDRAIAETRLLARRIRTLRTETLRAVRRAERLAR